MNEEKEKVYENYIKEQIVYNNVPTYSFKIETPFMVRYYRARKKDKKQIERILDRLYQIRNPNEARYIIREAEKKALLTKINYIVNGVEKEI